MLFSVKDKFVLASNAICAVRVLLDKDRASDKFVLFSLKDKFRFASNSTCAVRALLIKDKASED